MPWFFYYYLSCHWDKISDGRKEGREEGDLIWLTVPGCTRGREGRQQEGESASHIAPAVRKQRDTAGAHRLLYFLSWTLPHGMLPPTSKMALSVLQKPFWAHLHRYSQRCVSMVILNPVKLTTRINHHSLESERLMGIQGIVSDAGSWGQRPADWAPR